jgi:hypothetical protein
MHWEKGSIWEFVDCELAAPPAFAEAAELVDDGLPAHAVVSSAKAAVAMTADAVRAGGGHARRGRRRTRALWFIMPSSGLDDHAGAGRC